ncbi:hypothetical protein Esti_002648 [Eimeria stiedai]
MAQGHPDDDVSSEGSTISGLHHDLHPADRVRLWRWRFKAGGDRLPHYAPKIPHFLDDRDPDVELPGLLQALSLHEELPEHTSELAQKYALTKQKLDSLIQEKELLQWHINNSKKDLLLRRSESREVSQQLMSAKKKILHCRKAKETLQQEHAHLAVSASRLKAITNELQKERNEVAREHRRWLERRNEVMRETTQERKHVGFERKRRGKQLKKLQLAINRDKRVHVKNELLVRLSLLKEFRLQKKISLSEECMRCLSSRQVERELP